MCVCVLGDGWRVGGVLGVCVCVFLLLFCFCLSACFCDICIETANILKLTYGYETSCSCHKKQLHAVVMETAACSCHVFLLQNFKIICFMNCFPFLLLF